MPSTVTVNTVPIDALLGQIQGLADYDFTPLMHEWEEVLHEDNTAGALAGIDGFGIPLIPVTYRPDPNAGTRKEIDFGIQANNNLTSGHYRTLDGPPLAPRGMNSRIITEFATQWGNPAPGEWFAQGGWDRQDIMSIDSVPFLRFHFDGPDHNPNLPVRDLAHVRPTTLRRAQDVLHGYVTRLLKLFKGG
jgi:hypothetical protein